MNLLQKTLEKIGLNKKEAKVYLASLELGEASIQRIAKKAGINRSTAYLIVDDLKEKGLFRITIKDKKRFYFVEDPRILLEQLEEKKIFLNKAMPQFLGLAGFIDKAPRIKVLEGEEGIRSVFYDVLSYTKRKAYFFGTDVLNAKTIDLAQFFKSYFIPQRVKRRISVEIINPNTHGSNIFNKNNDKELRKMKVVNDKEFLIDASIMIYGDDKVGIIAYNESLSLIIESRIMYNALKRIFKLCWNNI